MKILSRYKIFFSDSVIFRPKWWKRLNQKLFVGIDSECFKTCFETKNLEIDNFFELQNFFLGISDFLAKNGEKWQTQQFSI